VRACVRACVDGEGNEEAEDNMEEADRNLDQMGTLLTGLNSMAVVSYSDSPYRLECSERCSRSTGWLASWLACLLAVQTG
jgi:hypothetical protein